MSKPVDKLNLELPIAHTVETEGVNQSPSVKELEDDLNKTLLELREAENQYNIILAATEQSLKIRENILNKINHKTRDELLKNQMQTFQLAIQQILNNQKCPENFKQASEILATSKQLIEGKISSGEHYLSALSGITNELENFSASLLRFNDEFYFYLKRIQEAKTAAGKKSSDLLAQLAIKNEENYRESILRSQEECLRWVKENEARCESVRRAKEIKDLEDARREAPIELRKRINKTTTTLELDGPIERWIFLDIRSELMHSVEVLKRIDMQTYENEFKKDIETLWGRILAAKWAPKLELEKGRQLLSEETLQFIDLKSLADVKGEVLLDVLVSKFKDNGLKTSFFEDILKRFNSNQKSKNTDANIGLKFNVNMQLVVNLKGFNENGCVLKEEIEFLCDYNTRYRCFVNMDFLDDLLETIAMVKIFRPDLFKSKILNIREEFNIYEKNWKRYMDTLRIAIFGNPSTPQAALIFNTMSQTSSSTSPVAIQAASAIVASTATAADGTSTSTASATAGGKDFKSNK